ncbi:MAG: hypothetical protein JWQ49_123 [Edaphobacter sp.]|nr:hypothetical protein [Edaphobacter sp.]
MATEKSRCFNEAQGSVHVEIENLHGHCSHHTIYVAGAHGVEDVAAHVEQLLIRVDAQAATVRERMIAAGMPTQ